MTTLPASLALPGGAPTQSHSEAADKSALYRIGRILKYTLLALLVTLMTIYTGLHAYVAWMLAHPVVAPLSSNPMLAKNLPYADVTFPSSDGATMVDGWWIPAIGGSSQSVVLSHGYGANREEKWVPMYDLADLLHGMGYNVLMFDYGFASGKYPLPATGGVLEARQLLGAIDFARSQGTGELIVWGFSMGAGTALQAALQHAPIDAMILDSTFIPTDETLAYNLAQSPIRLTDYPTIPLVKWFLPLMSGGFRLDQVPAAAAQATPFDFPVYLVHGTNDRKAPVYLAENVAKVQTNPYTQLWVVQGAIHEMIYRTHTQEYIDRITAFLGQVHILNIAKSLEPGAMEV